MTAVKMPCSVEGCDTPAKYRGWCESHYNRWRRHGDPTAGRKGWKTGRTKEEALLAGLPDRPSDPDECWDWEGQMHGSGYGRVNQGGKRHISHRVAYEVYVGTIPEGALIRHSCHNPLCCNPNHLSPGTPKDNSQDMVKASRSGKGSRNPQARLTEADVLDIRERYEAGGISQRELAEEYGVTPSTVYLIVKRKNWNWL